MSQLRVIFRDTEVDVACAVCGHESCENASHFPPQEADQVIESPEPSRPLGLHARTALEVIADPPPVEIVEGFAWSGCLSVVVSESGAGKTFALLGLAAAVSDGLNWHERSVEQGSVLYVSFEGDALALRLRALHEIQGYQLRHVYILRARDPLSPLATRDGETSSVGERKVTEAMMALLRELASTGRPPVVLVIIDTVRASLSGSEDSSEDAAAYLRAVRRLMAHVPHAAAILAHHAGWQDGEHARQRERGSSAWRGNCDATFYLRSGLPDTARHEVTLTLSALKVRDGERPSSLRLLRRRVEIGQCSRRGVPLTSCVIERDRRTPEDMEAERTHRFEAAQLETDLRVLRVIAEYKTSVTSHDAIRAQA